MIMFIEVYRLRKGISLISDEVVCPRSSAARKKGGQLNVFNLCIIYIYKLFYSISLFITATVGYCLISRTVRGSTKLLW